MDLADLVWALFEELVSVVGYLRTKVFLVLLNKTRLVDNPLAQVC